jgi:hypothetical protein
MGRTPMNVLVAMYESRARAESALNPLRTFDLFARVAPVAQKTIEARHVYGPGRDGSSIFR